MYRHSIDDHFDNDDDDDDDVENNNDIDYCAITHTVEQGRIQGSMVNGSGSGTVGSGASGSGVISVRAGNFIRIDLQISGSPIPTVTWLKDHQPVLLGNRVRQSEPGYKL